VEEFVMPASKNLHRCRHQARNQRCLSQAINHVRPISWCPIPSKGMQ
jgi:hypothetical protein